MTLMGGNEAWKETFLASIFSRMQRVGKLKCNKDPTPIRDSFCRDYRRRCRSNAARHALIHPLVFSGKEKWKKEEEHKKVKSEEGYEGDKSGTAAALEDANWFS